VFRSAVIAAFAIVFAFSIGISSPPIVRADAPGQGTFFEYNYDWYVDQGSGTYDGYSETMTSHSRYVVMSSTGNTSSLHAGGTWQWSASDGNHQSGVLDLTFSYYTDTRRYVSTVDVEGTYSDPRVWFWVPVPLSRGQQVRILDDIFTVSDLDATVWDGFAPLKAAAMVATGSYYRNDAYGRFDAAYTDTYYFDRATGLVVAERYTEQDTNGEASFRWHANVDVTWTSYPVPFDSVAIVLVYGGIPAMIAAAGYGVWRVRRGPLTIPVTDQRLLATALVRRIRKTRDLQGLDPATGSAFDAFLPTFARRAIQERDPLAIATNGTRLLGIITLDKEAHVGSVIAADGLVARGLLRRVRSALYFADVRDGGSKPGTVVVDTLSVLALDDVRQIPYDASAVRPMAAGDIAPAAAVSQKVYQGPAAHWIRSCLEDGDFGFVAVADNRVVGYALATVADSMAWLHGLTVLPEYRGRGLGSALMAARLSALSAMGVTRVITEIATTNEPSLRVSRRVGFGKIGETQLIASRKTTARLAAERRT